MFPFNVVAIEDAIHMSLCEPVRSLISRRQLFLVPPKFEASFVPYSGYNFSIGGRNRIIQQNRPRPAIQNTRDRRRQDIEMSLLARDLR